MPRKAEQAPAKASNMAVSVEQAGNIFAILNNA
jgi:hypothetical protein